VTVKEQMLDDHLRTRQSYYSDRLDSMHFEEPYFIKDDKESVVSNSPKNKEAYITRHWMTGEIHYAMILAGSTYNRL